jgi:hypothetical protein
MVFETGLIMFFILNKKWDSFFFYYPRTLTSLKSFACNSDSMYFLRIYYGFV